MPRRPAGGAGQCACSVVRHAARAIRPHSMPLPGSSCIEVEVRENDCRLRETFVAIVVSEDRR